MYHIDKQAVFSSRDAIHYISNSLDELHDHLTDEDYSQSVVRSYLSPNVESFLNMAGALYAVEELHRNIISWSYQLLEDMAKYPELVDKVAHELHSIWPHGVDTLLKMRAEAEESVSGLGEYPVGDVPRGA